MTQKVLDGSVAVVTGGASGIGRSTARRSAGAVELAESASGHLDALSCNAGPTGYLLPKFLGDLTTGRSFSGVP